MNDLELELATLLARPREASESVAIRVPRDVKALLDRVVGELEKENLMPRRMSVVVRDALLMWIRATLTRLAAEATDRSLDGVEEDREGGRPDVDILGTGSPPEEIGEIETAGDALVDLARVAPDSALLMVEEVAHRLLVLAGERRRS